MRSVIVYPLSGAHECAGAVATSVTILDLGSEKKKTVLTNGFCVSISLAFSSV